MVLEQENNSYILSKVEKLNVTSDKPMGVFILPAKTDDNSTETESD